MLAEEDLKFHDFSTGGPLQNLARAITVNDLSCQAAEKQTRATNPHEAARNGRLNSSHFV